MAYDPNLTRDVDWIRFLLNDTNDSAPIIQEAEYAALLAQLGYRQAGFMAATKIQTSRELLLKWTDGDVSEDPTAAAKAIEGIATKFRTGIYDRGGSMTAAKVVRFVNPDMTTYRTD